MPSGDSVVGQGYKRGFKHCIMEGDINKPDLSSMIEDNDPVQETEITEDSQELDSAKGLFKQIAGLVGFYGENYWFLRPDLVRDNFTTLVSSIDQMKRLVSQHGLEIFDRDVALIDGFLLILRYAEIGDIDLAKEILSERMKNFPGEYLLPAIRLIYDQSSNSQEERTNLLVSYVESQSEGAFQEWLSFTRESLIKVLLSELMAEGQQALSYKRELVSMIRQYDSDLASNCYQPYLIRDDKEKMKKLESIVTEIVNYFFQENYPINQEKVMGSVVVATNNEGYQRFIATGKYHGQIHKVDGNVIGGWNQRKRAEAMLGIDALGIDSDQLSAYGVMSVGSESHDSHQYAGYGDIMMHLRSDSVVGRTIFTTGDSGAYFQRRSTTVESRFGVEGKNIWQLDWQHASHARLIMDRIQATFPSIKEVYGQDYIEAQVLSGFDLGSVDHATTVE